jgi:hypothetical protein
LAGRPWRCLLGQSEVISLYELHRRGQVSADRGEKNIVGAIGDFVERGSLREHPSGRAFSVAITAEKSPAPAKRDAGVSYRKPASTSVVKAKRETPHASSQPVKRRSSAVTMS